MGVVNWEFRSSLSKGLSEPPRSAVAPRKARNTCFGVFLLLAFLLRLLCQKKSGKRFRMSSSRKIPFYEKQFKIAYPLFSLRPEAQMKTGYASLRRESQVIHAWQKRTRQKEDFAACARRPTLRALDGRSLFEKSDVKTFHKTTPWRS